MSNRDEIHRDMLRQAVELHGLDPAEFSHVDDDENENVKMELGRWKVMDEDDQRGLYLGDEGDLHAEVVGSPTYSNERVGYFFTSEGADVGEEVVPFEDIEPME